MRDRPMSLTTVRRPSGGAAITRHAPRGVGWVAAVATMLASSAAFANPEAGGAASQTNNLVFINSADFAKPTVLRSVSIKCPAAGFLIANADAAFQLGFTAGATFGVMDYGISRTTAFDTGDDHLIEVANPNIIIPTIPGGIQRFDTCAKGQTVTYRFVAFLRVGLGTNTNASQPRLSAIFLRDHD